MKGGGNQCYALGWKKGVFIENHAIEISKYPMSWKLINVYSRYTI